MWRLFGRRSNPPAQPRGESPSESSRTPPSRSPRPVSRREVSNSIDPFKLDGPLFEYLTHMAQDGESFVGYRTKGNPMVLTSLVDGTALASIHVQVSDGRGNALITRHPDDPNAFEGVLTVDRQAFEIVMTNLTTDSVLMMDIGGVARVREHEFWDRKDKDFWSGRHRNDNRLNSSNILWPMLPNCCQENHSHFLETGFSAALELRAHDSNFVKSSSSSESTQEFRERASFPVHVYPKYGSAGTPRFERTAWLCPETIVVIGTPVLVGVEEDAHIVGERSHWRRSESLSMQALNQAGENGVANGVAKKVPDTIVDTVGVTTGARPAEVVAGRVKPTQKFGLLIEQFDFDHAGAPATLRFAVHESLQITEEVGGAELAALVKDITADIAERCTGRRRALMEEMPLVYRLPECVICLCSNPQPNAVLYQCGHRCAHLHCIAEANLRRCPLCRARITAVLPEYDEI